MKRSNILSYKITFSYDMSINVNYHLLTSMERELIKDIMDFQFTPNIRFKDLESQMKVEIRTEEKVQKDRTPVSRKVIEDALEVEEKNLRVAQEDFDRLRAEISRLYNRRDEPSVKDLLDKLRIQCNHAEGKLGDAKMALYYYNKLLGGGDAGLVYPERRILGEFFPGASPKVVLYLGSFPSGENTRHIELIPTFVHEMFHAVNYFMSNGTARVREVEEPMVEFATGVFLTAISKTNVAFEHYYDYHRNTVKHKQYHIGEETCYGFGVYLMDNVDNLSTHKEEEWIETYSQKAWKVNPAGSIPSEIASSLYPSYPKDESRVFQLFEILLFGKHPKHKSSPSAGVSSIPGSKSSLSGAIPRLRATEDWSLTATKLGWAAQCPLISNNDFIQLLTEIIRVMKREGFESYLSLAGDKIVFLGNTFSHFTTSPSRSTIPESLCVKGVPVFPDFPFSLFGPAIQVGNILYALGVLLDGVFTIVHEKSNYTLYGPVKYEKLFSAATVSTTTVPASSPSRSIQTYDIIDKTTSRVLGSEKGMGKTALFIIRQYCSMNPGITFTNLQKVFGSIGHHSSGSMGIIELLATVNAYKIAHPADLKPRFFESAPIYLSNGDVVLVSSQWAANGIGENFSEFKTIADSLGYTIIIR